MTHLVLLGLIIMLFRFLARKLVSLLMTPLRHSLSTIPDSPAGANDNILRILTFNIANYNDHGKWPERLNSLVSIILSSKPHLIALQEIRFDALQATTAQSYLDMAQQILSRLRACDPTTFGSATLLTAPAMWYRAEPPQWEGLSIISTLPVRSSSVHYLPSSDTTDTNRRILQSATVSLAPLLLPTKASGAQTQNQGPGVSEPQDRTPNLSRTQDPGQSPSQSRTSSESRGRSQAFHRTQSQSQSQTDGAADSVVLLGLPPCRPHQSPWPENRLESESESESESEPKAGCVSGPAGELPPRCADRNEADGRSGLAVSEPRSESSEKAESRRQTAGWKAADPGSTLRRLSGPLAPQPASPRQCEPRSESESEPESESRRQTAGWKAADVASTLRRLRKMTLVSSHDAGSLAPQPASPREHEPRSESESGAESEGPGGGRSSLSSWVVLSDADDDKDESLPLNDAINAHDHPSLSPAPSAPLPGRRTSDSDSVPRPPEPFEPPLPLSASRFASWVPTCATSHPSNSEPGSESGPEPEQEPSPRPCAGTSAGLGFPRNPSASSLVTVGVGSVCSASSGLWGCSLESGRSWVLVSSESEQGTSCACRGDAVHVDAPGQGARRDNGGQGGPCGVRVGAGGGASTPCHSTLPYAVASCSRHVVDDISGHIPGGNQDIAGSSGTHRHFADSPGSGCAAAVGLGMQRDVTGASSLNCDEDVTRLSSRKCGAEETRHVGHVDGVLRRSDSDVDTCGGRAAHARHDVVNMPTRLCDECDDLEDAGVQRRKDDALGVQAARHDVANDSVQVRRREERANCNAVGTQSHSVDAGCLLRAHVNVQRPRRQDAAPGFRHVSDHPRSERDVTSGPADTQNIDHRAAHTADRAPDSDSDCDPGAGTAGHVMRQDDLDPAAGGSAKPCTHEPHVAAVTWDVSAATRRSIGPAEGTHDVTSLYPKSDPVPGPGLEPPDDVTLVLANAHFSYSEPLRLEQVSASLRHLSSLNSSSSPRPIATVLVGDFNAVPTESCIELIRRGGYVDAWEWLKEGSCWQGGATFPASNPAFRIDYVFVDEGFAPRLASLEVVPRWGWVGALPSDHCGVLVQLDLTAAGAIDRTAA